MAELTLHFEASEDTNLKAAAAALQDQLVEVQGVESADTTAQSFQSIGPSEVLSILQIGTQIAEQSTLFITAMAGLVAAWQKIRPMFPGLKAPTVEVGLKQVPIDQLTEEHRTELVAQ